MTAVAPAASVLALMLAPTALAADTGEGTTATATFDAVSCTSHGHTVDVSVKNPSPSSATFSIHVSGPHVAVPNSITVPAAGSNGVKVTLPRDATSATVSDSSGDVIGTTSIDCSDSSTSSAGPTSSAGASSGASSGSSASSSSSASTSVAAPAPASTKTSSGSSDNGTRKLVGYGIAGLGVLIAIALLIREFK